MIRNSLEIRPIAGALGAEIGGSILPRSSTAKPLRRSGAPGSTAAPGIHLPFPLERRLDCLLGQSLHP
ncbi:MAG: hypothetical protein WCB44_10925, partial [Stellaceae bacterium]